MTKKLTTTGKLLTANRESRILRYRLLPFGEPGSTNRGKITASAGSVEIPAEPLPTNIEHDQTRPVGKMSVEETSEGLEASVAVANTRAGDDLLEEAEAGLRAGISVEIENPVIRAGKLVAGLLSGAGHVVKPAYPSALLVAADFGEIEPDLADAAAATADAEEATEDGDVAAAEEALAAAVAALEEARAKLAEGATPADPADPAPPAQKEETMSASKPASTEALLASLAAALGAKASTPATGSAKPGDAKLEASGLSLAKFTATAQGISSGALTAAALDTITQTDLYDPTAQPDYQGELWGGTVYDERYAPLVTHAPLTAMSVKGWRWVEGKSPIVDDWDPAFEGVAPNEAMTDIPTGEVVAEADEWFAKRLAGGNRFDRVHIDFPVPGVLESFLFEQTEYIKRRRDARVKQHIVAQAALPARTITGTGKDVATPWAKLILGAMHVMEYATPTYAIVGNDLYRELLASDMLENLAMLETSLSLKEGALAGFKIQPAEINDAAMNGTVTVGAAKATVLHEPAGVIRVDAQELIKGAVDKAVFSYYLLRSDERGGIVRVTEGV